MKKLLLAVGAIVGGLMVLGSFDNQNAPAAKAEPSIDLAAGSACVGVDEFNETARYVADHYSLKDGMRLKDMDAVPRNMLSGMIVMQQMDSRGRAACRDLDALWQHRSADMLRRAGTR